VDYFEDYISIYIFLVNKEFCEYSVHVATSRPLLTFYGQPTMAQYDGPKSGQH